MADQWEQGSFFIIVNGPDGQRLEEVEGVACGVFGIQPVNPECSYPAGMHHVLTHLPSGYYLAYFPTQAAAQKFCRLIGALTDWSKVTPESWPALKPQLSQKLHVALRASGGEQSPPRVPVADSDDDIPF